MSIGIDFGTLFSCAGGFDNSMIRILENMPDRKLPNFVTFKSDSTREIGELAKAKIGVNLNKTIFNSKILMAGEYENTYEFTHKLCPFELKNNEDRIEILSNDQLYQPEEITAIFLNKIRESAKSFFKFDEIKKVTISVPANFNDSQRQATLDAAKIAGFNNGNVRLINDTTAAAIAIFHEKKYSKSNSNILIFDLGGYFLNLCIFEVKNDSLINIRCCSSHEKLGGQIIDLNILEFLLNNVVYLKENKEKLSPRRTQTLLAYCEKAKKILSNDTESFIEIDENTENFPLYRKLFDEINKDLFDKCLENIDRLLKSIKMKKNEIDEIFLIGGSSRIPKLQSNIKEFFLNKISLNYSANGNETVAYGSSVHSAYEAGNEFKNSKKFILNDKSVFDYLLKINLNGNELSIEIPKFTTLPAYQSLLLYEPYKYNSIELKLFENDKKISFKNLDQFQNPKIEKIEIRLEIDLNSMVIIKIIDDTAKTVDEKLYRINSEKLYCLNSDKINAIIESNKDQTNKLEEIKKLKVFKNSCEEKCYELKRSSRNMDKKIEDEINTCLEKIKKSYTTEELKNIDTDLVRLENKILSLKNKKLEESKGEVPSVDQQKELTEKAIKNNEKESSNDDQELLSKKFSELINHLETCRKFVQFYSIKKYFRFNNFINEINNLNRLSNEEYSNIEKKTFKELLNLLNHFFNYLWNSFHMTANEYIIIRNEIVSQENQRNVNEFLNKISDVLNGFHHQDLEKINSLIIFFGQSSLV